MKTRSLLLFALAPALVMSLGCERTREQAPGSTSRDSSGVILVSHSPGLLETLPRWRISEKPDFVIGEGAETVSDQGSQFFMLSGVFRLSRDRVLVASDISKQLLVFDTAGSLQWSVGRFGAGPSEFRHLDLVGSFDASVATIFDALNRRLSILSFDSAPSRYINLAQGPRGGLNPEYRFRDGRLLARIPRGVPKDAPRNGVYRDTEQVVIVDSTAGLQVDFGAHAGVDIHAHEPGLTFGFALDAPFSRRLFVAANDSAVLLASSGAFTFSIYRPSGELSRIVRVNGSRQAVTAKMRRAYRESLMKTATDERTRIAWEMRSADEVFPDSMPAYDQLVLAREGHVWVRLASAGDREIAEWLVFDLQGAPLARVGVPAALALHDIDGTAVLGVWTDEWSREQVRGYHIVRAAGR